MAFKDLTDYGVTPSDQELSEQELEKERQAELDKIDWLGGVEKVSSQEILFAPEVEGEPEEERSKNTLYAYYSKDLGVENLPIELFDALIEEDFGKDADYDTSLASLKETKRWGAEGFEPTKLELAKYEDLTAGDWLRSFSGHTTKAVHGVSAGLFRAAAGMAGAVGQEDSGFYDLMMGAADEANLLGEERASTVFESGFFEDAISDNANEDVLAQNLGQLLMVVGWWRGGRDCHRYCREHSKNNLNCWKGRWVSCGIRQSRHVLQRGV